MTAMTTEPYHGTLSAIYELDQIKKAIHRNTRSPALLSLAGPTEEEHQVYLANKRRLHNIGENCGWDELIPSPSCFVYRIKYYQVMRKLNDYETLYLCGES